MENSQKQTIQKLKETSSNPAEYSTALLALLIIQCDALDQLLEQDNVIDIKELSRPYREKIKEIIFELSHTL
jgi:hypothetical protein